MSAPELATEQTNEHPQGTNTRRRRFGVGLVFIVATLILIPTTGDLGLTWDEPAYRFSQLRSAAWWSRLAQVRSLDDLRPLLEPDALLYYWTYARQGINFHPPLAGQLNLLTFSLFSPVMNDTSARRLASEFEFALTVAIGFGFLARRYSLATGLVMAGSLFVMPRIFGQAHLAETDTPGLLLWVATSLAFWKGLNEPRAGGWRVLVGVLLGLAFVEKMAAVFVLLPLLIWMVATRLPRASSKADWIDGVLTSSAMLAPLGLAFLEILRISKKLPQPKFTNLFDEHHESYLPGLIFAVPFLVWVIRRLLGNVFRSSKIWGTERPALEIWTAIIAFAPLVGWLGNPAWWRDTLPRFAHYYLLNTDRRGSLPDIQILYLGQIYEYSLPWHNVWILMGVTVPLAILIASAFGLPFLLRNIRRDLIPVYFLLHFLTLPVFRMFPTPAHDGVRLFLPTFFFMAAFAGWGVLGVSSAVSWLFRLKRPWIPSTVLSLLVLVPASFQLIRVHPYELSYYNELAGGPAKAWKSGDFELTYWYDAFTPATLNEINAKLPKGATVDFLNPRTMPMTFIELQSLGELRSDIKVAWQGYGPFPYVWLLTQDSKASAFTRLLFAMKPWYESSPKQLDGARVVTVADPVAVSRAFAIRLLTDAPDELPPDQPVVPTWVNQYAPWLGRLWGVGLTKIARLTLYKPLFKWVETDPNGLLAAAKGLAVQAESGPKKLIERAQKKAKGEKYDPIGDVLQDRLFEILVRDPNSTAVLFQARPEALIEAVEILIAHPKEVRALMTRSSYTDLETIGGPLDRDLKTK